MRRRTFFIIAILVMLVAVAIYAYREYHRTNVNLTTVEADYTVQAAALVDEFLNNDSLAYNKYRNKILAVEGVVKSVDREAGDCTLVLGDTGAMSSSVRCLLDSLAVKHVAAVKQGDRLTVKGAITGFKKDETGLLGSDVELNRCVVEKNEK